ncbi:GNAT family N-acetyltransferase [Rubrobacter aplysinae]|uniref:GNAT family N-acetyltransferase n=1 Tax=Rubrobacter aplysinae TaxID=909625 RepID=UPI001364A1E4|nr:GNAT family N-acetyltransferase [Rubrobacter aplysinae]
MEVGPAPADDLRPPLRLLEAELREGEPLPEEIVRSLADAVRAGEADVITARAARETSETGSDAVLGTALLYYRLNLSSGGRFASFEELHVAPGSRGRGVGRALLAEVERRCSEKGISYIEAQIIAESVEFFFYMGYESEPDLKVLSRSIAFGGYQAEEDI